MRLCVAFNLLFETRATFQQPVASSFAPEHPDMTDTVKEPIRAPHRLANLFLCPATQFFETRIGEGIRNPFGTITFLIGNAGLDPTLPLHGVHYVIEGPPAEPAVRGETPPLEFEMELIRMRRTFDKNPEKCGNKGITQNTCWHL